MSDKPLVAVLGLGTMGSGMARRLLEAGYEAKLFNRSPERYKSFKDSGAVLCKSPAEAATGADIVISMVSDDLVSRSLWQGPQGALSTAGAGAVLVECSTLSLDWVQELENLAKARGCRFLDAPVTGSKDQAESGKLKFLVGGDAETIAAIAPVLSVMSVEIVPLGPVGSGTTLKLVNNFLCGAQIAALAEGLAVLDRHGLNQNVALAVLMKGAVGSPLLQTIMARVASDDFTPNFSVSLIEKDLSYAINEGAKVGVDLSSAEAARSRFQQANAAGLGERDIASLVKWFLETPCVGNARA